MGDFCFGYLSWDFRGNCSDFIVRFFWGGCFFLVFFYIIYLVVVILFIEFFFIFILIFGEFKVKIV